MDTETVCYQSEVLSGGQQFGMELFICVYMSLSHFYFNFLKSSHLSQNSSSANAAATRSVNWPLQSTLVSTKIWCQ